MTRGRWIAALIGICVLFAAWVFGSPHWTLYQMRDAAQDRDADAFAKYIDFPPLRESLKSQLRAQMLAEAQRPENARGFGAAGAMIAMAFVDPMIDGLLTPDAMRVMFAQREDAAPQEQRAPLDVNIGNAAPQEQRAPLGVNTEDASVTYGLNEFHLRTGEASGSAVVVFTRHGLSWKLSDIRIPADALRRNGPAAAP
jgi:hypothetical protein